MGFLVVFCVRDTVATYLALTMVDLTILLMLCLCYCACCYSHNYHAL